MAYVVARSSKGRKGEPRRTGFEIRESELTDRGPRARSLASFRVLDDAVLARARARALRPFDPAAVRRSAHRVGALVDAADPAERSARSLLAELGRGAHVAPALAALLRGALATDLVPDDGVEAMVPWITASAAQRGVALRDLLELGDRFPARVATANGVSEDPVGAVSELSLPDKLVAIDEAFDHHDVPHAFGGAIALAYYGEPRVTVDLDCNVFLPHEGIDTVEHVLAPLGVDFTFDRVRALADGQLRVMWGRTPVDLFFSSDPFHDAMEGGTRRVPFGDAFIRILGPEHLVVCKAIFDRPKDWLDIPQVLVGVECFDPDEVRRWLDAIVGSDDGRRVRFDTLARELLAR